MTTPIHMSRAKRQRELIQPRSEQRAKLKGAATMQANRQARYTNIKMNKPFFDIGLF